MTRVDSARFNHHSCNGFAALISNASLVKPNPVQVLYTNL